MHQQRSSFFCRSETQKVYARLRFLTGAGESISCSRTELEGLLAREELDKAGVFTYWWEWSSDQYSHVYIGEAEVIRDRLKQHRVRILGNQGHRIRTAKMRIVTKAHVRYIESRLISEATQDGRFTLEQTKRWIKNPWIWSWRYGSSFIPELGNYYLFLVRFARTSRSCATKAQPGGLLILSD